jgi:tetratricopeptide (TPR) repeat protein
LEKAYASLQARDYDAAISAFRQAAEEAPSRASIRKDLAYALLKIGENEAARDEFAEAVKLDPADHHVALEYAFLCHETGREAVARRVFDRVRKTGDPASRTTAEQAFGNIDRPLAEGIARWKKALEVDPGNFSAHRELARLADQRDEWALASEHYQQAWKLRPDQRSLLLELGRVWEEVGQTERSRAALLAASRGAEPRAAEEARALLPSRYPYVYEFEQALELDPGNVELRREFAYLLLEMGGRTEAERQFSIISEQAPEDLLSAAQLGFLRLSRKDYEGAMPLLRQVLESADDELADRVRTALSLPQTLRRRPETPRSKVSTEAKVLAERSLEAGYLKDAMKYLRIAHETDPVDFSVMLNLGRTHNILKQDEQAVRWFDLARRSPDPEVAEEAERAYKNLRPAFARFRTTFWIMPFYSSRWRDFFGYAQFRTEVRLGKLPFRPYVSVRFTGDARRTIGSVAPEYLSESSFVFGVGVRTPNWNGFTAWAEAGSDVSYLDREDRSGRMAPDYRGGVAFGKGYGDFLGGEAPGAFLSTYNDGVFMSRFDNTFLASTRNRFGYTAPVAEALGGLQTQFYWNGNVTLDTKRQPWANFVETGPGLRFRWKSMPSSLVFSIDLLRGAYVIGDNPRGRDYYDIRAGFWYAITR